MDKLPTKSLSKTILIATPLFCIVLAILDAADQLSYLFVLQFLGNVAGNADLMFIPTTQPEVRSNNYAKNQMLRQNNIENNMGALEESNLFLLQMNRIEQWAKKNPNINGVSPRWIIPISLPKTDSLLLIANITQQLNLGLCSKSNLQPLNSRQVSISRQLLNKLQIKIGQKLPITLSLNSMFQGTKLIEKYQSFESKEETVVESEELNIDKISKLLYEPLSTQAKQFNLTIKESDVKLIVAELYNFQFSLDYTVKYQYKNNGLYSSALHNVVLMQFSGFAQFLSEIIIQKVINNRQLTNELVKVLQDNQMPQDQVFIVKNAINFARTTGIYNQNIKDTLFVGLRSYPLLVVSNFKSRELVYHPNKKRLNEYLTTMENTPGEYQVISVYPFYKDLEGIRFFFKSVIQIFTFICAVIYFYIMRLIFKQIYEEKEIQVGIWRTLGAGGVKAKQKVKNSNISYKDEIEQLQKKLSTKQKLTYGYQLLVKVGFLYYWLISSLISALLYFIIKVIIYNSVCNYLLFTTPPQQVIHAILVFICIFGFNITLIIMHIRQIYINPLVSTIKPVKRTFDVVKIRVIKVATFGITLETLIIAIMLIYYGVVSYYFIPYSILYNDGQLQTFLFNTIFVFMIFGAIILISILQSRMECSIFQLLFKFSKKLRNLKLIILKTIKAKQYKNIKVSIIISISFAFLLFFASGLRIQMSIVQSFIERQLGAQLVMQNYEKNTFNRTEIDAYLKTVEGIRYSWLSNNLNNKNIDISFEGIIATNRFMNADFKIFTSNYLDTTYYEYYYPQEYIQKDKKSYEKLGNGVYNGFNSIYNKTTGQSIGHFNPEDTFTEYDPFCINIDSPSDFLSTNHKPVIAPDEQVVNLVITSLLRTILGVKAGDIYKINISNKQKRLNFKLRSRVTHSLKIGPGLDLFRRTAYLSEDQAKYLYNILQVPLEEIKYEKLFITGSNLNAVGNKILSISPKHTQMFQMNIVKQSFALLQDYINGFIVLVTVILGSLSVLFLFVYTYGKCKQEAEVFKMLRAIGISVFDLRLIIFLEILIRIVISIINGIIFGIFFSLLLSGQIEQVLMINTPALKLTSIIIIAFVMIALFSMTVIRSTEYLTKRTVLETSKA